MDAKYMSYSIPIDLLDQAVKIAKVRKLSFVSNSELIRHCLRLFIEKGDDNAKGVND